jgi:F-type H+-transporting ATPase subunit gamma
MPDLRELQRKLESIRALKDVVNAMRNLAAVYVRRAESALRGSRPYGEVVSSALRVVLDRARPEGPASEPEGPTMAVVFASDQGLAGTFNERAVAAATEFAGSSETGTSVCAIGLRGGALLTQRGVEPGLTLRAPTSLEGIRSRVPEIAAAIFEAYQASGAGQMHFVYNAFESVGRFRPVVRRVIPPVLAELQGSAGGRFTYEPILTEPPERLLPRLVEEYFFIELYQSLLESHASENGARLTSMTAAASNIDEQIAEVTQLYQSVRQESITAELMDVVSGTEALRDEEPGG